MIQFVGELNVSLYDFYAMTWSEWCSYSKGLLRRRSLEWEHTRAISWMIYKSNSDAKKSAKNMVSWWKLPTDPGYAAKMPRAKGKRLTKIKTVEFFNSMR